MNRFGQTWPMVPERFPLSSCGCNEFPAQPCGPRFPVCGPTGCPLYLDTSCVLYHQFGNSPTGLINLGLPNGSTAELIFNTIDGALGVLNVNNWALPFLRGIFGGITNLQQFGQAVDIEFSILNIAVSNIQSGVTGVPVTVTNTATIDFALSGPLNHHISANVNVSAGADNQLSIVGDGLFSAPQTLSINAGAKTLSISNGNTVNLSSLVCGVSGFLGDVTSDPASVIDGQYWYNTTSSQLKIQLNGATRIITIT